MAQKTPLLRPLREKGATMYVFPSAHEDIGLNLNSRATGVALSHYALLNIGKFKSTGNANEEMAVELQNYVMNFETLLLNQDNYNYLDYHTVSERVFWHWMMKKGFINIDYLESSDPKKNTNTLIETGDSRIVLCFGSIDAGNSLSTEFGMFNETYINIPTSYGSGPVFFNKCQSDINYLLNHEYSGDNKLLGREEKPSGLYLTDSTPLYDNGSNYKTEDKDGIEILKDINLIQKELGKNIIINSYDDININLESATDFDFNVILLYYSVYDQDDTTKSPYAINLFGIIFLDGFVKSGEVYTIPSIHKKKSTNSYFGNSYSFRVNIKTMSVYDNTGANILDNTTLSSIYSVDFSDVISNLNRAIDVMNTNVHTTMSILDEYMKIRAYYDDLYNIIQDISNRLNGLVFGSPTNTLNTSTLLSNVITPHDAESNELKLQVYSKYSDITDSADNKKYTVPVSIKNTYNVPALYYPLVDILTELEVEQFKPISARSLATYAKDLITNIDVSWYNTADNKVYPIINFSENITLDSLIDTSSNGINYNLLLTCMLDYLKTISSPEFEITLSDEDYNRILNYIIDKIKADDNKTFQVIVENLVNANIDDINNRINSITANISNINTNIYTINDNINDISNRLKNNSSGTNKDFSEDIKDLDLRIVNLDKNTNSNINTINSNINTINSNITTINSSINNINSSINDLWTALYNQKDVINQLSALLEDTNKKLTEALQWQKES